MDYKPIELQREPHITDAVLSKLQKHYKGLSIVKSQASPTIDLVVAALSDQEVQDLQLDLAFYKKNPRLPLESICSKLSNYEPENQSQQELLFYAKALIEFNDPSVASGLFIYGESGVGKSHIAIAVTKEFMKTGQDAYFSSASDLRRYTDLLGPNQVWIIDDLNSPYGLPMGDFKKVVLNAHNCGGRVFATSNTAYSELMEYAFVSDAQEKPRYMDRIKGMFKVLEVTGESARQEKSWFAGLALTKVQKLKIDLMSAVNREDFKTAAEIRDEIVELEGAELEGSQK